MITHSAFGSLRLPTNLNSSDREKVLKTIGQGTASKFLSNPFSLGGFDGLEIGLSTERISTNDLGTLGDKTNIQEDLTFTRLMVGKGLFNNIDIYGHFIPFSQSSQMSSYGALLRIGLVEASFIPANLSLVASFDSGNLSNKLNFQNVNIDLYFGVKVSSVSLLFGAGYNQSYGTFSGGTASLSDTMQEETLKVAGPHSSLALLLDFDYFFIGASIDRYDQTVFSTRLGFRF